jgi:predicted RNase H-like HicB family nuclease
MLTMVQPVTFTARYETVEDSWVQATIDELPGVVTAAPTHEEAKELLADALHAYLLVLGDLQGEPETPHAGEAEPMQLTVNA